MQHNAEPVNVRSWQVRAPGSRGYSLSEALVTVAIIGTLTLVSVPSFLNMQRASRMKTSVRNFTADLRFARQRAVMKNRRVLITFAPSTTVDRGRYALYEGTLNTDGTVTWSLLQRRPGENWESELSDTVKFASTTFVDKVDPTPSVSTDNGQPDIIYRENGTIDSVDLPSGVTEPTVTITTSYPIQKNSYAITFSTAGNVRAN